LAGCIGGLVEPLSLPPPPPQAAKNTEITTGQITVLNADFMAIFFYYLSNQTICRGLESQAWEAE
jgi:hypothetical protein